MFILIIVALLIVGVLVYFFVIKGKKAPASDATLVSTNTGAAQGLQNQNPTDQSTTGSQIVEILRNLSVIKLDDSVFRNPAFGLLRDMSVAIPPVINQGRRNPFAPVGNDAAVTTTETTPGPSF